MKGKKIGDKYIVIASSIVLGVFIAVIFMNLHLANNEGTYYSSSIVEAINYESGKLSVTVKNENSAVCIKQTKTTPSNNSLCWTNTINRSVKMSIYEYKTYYVWIKDSNGVITYYGKYNTNND